MRQTKFTVLTQGDVHLSFNYGYGVVGNEEAVCFFIDALHSAYINSSTTSDNDCPEVSLSSSYGGELTDIEFTEFKGWRFHAGSDGGKCIAIALVNKESEVCR